MTSAMNREIFTTTIDLTLKARKIFLPITRSVSSTMSGESSGDGIDRVYFTVLYLSFLGRKSTCPYELRDRNV